MYFCSYIMKLKNDISFAHFTVVILCFQLVQSNNSLTSIEQRRYRKYGKIFPDEVEQGTKMYEYQLDTGNRRDERPDSVLTYLELLDRNISKILMDPLKGQGPYLISYVKTFAEEALRLRNMLVNKTVKEDETLKESAIKVYHRYGHPRFMTVFITRGGEYLQNTLQLSDDLMWEFYCYRQKANEFWDEIRAVLVKNYRSDKIEAERFRNLPWPKHLDNLTSFEKGVLERSDLDSKEFNLEDILNMSLIEKNFKNY